MTIGAYGVQDSAKVVLPTVARATARSRRTGEGRLGREADRSRDRKRSLFGLLAEQRRFVYLAVALLSAAGIWAALALPSAIYPELTFPRITIVVAGQLARRAAGAVQHHAADRGGGQHRARRDARAVALDPRRQRDRTSRSRRRPTWSYALQQVQARVNQVRGDLPPDLDIEVERLTPSLFPILSYNLEGGDPATLYDIARYQIKPVLSRVPGVGRVDVQGSDVREIEVVADPARLARSRTDVRRPRRRDPGARPRSSAVGRMPQDYKQYLIVTARRRTRRTTSRTSSSRTGCASRDLATVRTGTEDHVRIVAGDGKPAALINITRQIGGNTLAIADSVARDRGGARARRCRRACVLKPVYDQAALVRDAVQSVRDAMLIGAALAVIVLLLFLRHARITAISASSIPLTLAITVFVMSLRRADVQPDDARRDGDRDRPRDRRRGGDHREHRAAPAAHARPHARDPRGGAGADLAGDDVDAHDGRRLPAARPAHGRRGAVLQRAVDHADDRGAGVAGARADDHSAAQRAVPHGRATPSRGATRSRDARRARAASAAAIDSLADRYERALGARAAPRALDRAGRGAARRRRRARAARCVDTGFLPEMDEGAFVLDYWTPGGTALAETDRQVNIVERILAGDAGDRRHVAPHRRRARALRHGAESRRHRRAPQAASASATARSSR